jgi:hypothetical protein
MCSEVYLLVLLHSHGEQSSDGIAAVLKPKLDKQKVVRDAGDKSHVEADS